MKLFATDRALTPSWDLLNPSMELLKKNIWQVVYLSIIPNLLITLGAVMLPTNMPNHFTSREYQSFAIMGIGGVWSFFTYTGYTYLLAKASQGEEISVTQALIAGLKRLFPLLGATILTGIVVAIGLLLLIVPGLIWLRAFYLTPYYIVDQNMGPIKAMKQSYRDSKPVSGWLWGTIGVTLAFSLLGSITRIIPVIGILLEFGIIYLYAFGPSIRYVEVVGKRAPQLTED